MVTKETLATTIESIKDLDRNNQYEDEIALVESSIDRWPDEPSLHFHRGRVLRILGHTQDAIQSFRRALDLDSTFLDAMFSLVAMGKGEMAGGLAALNQLESRLDTPKDMAGFHYAKARLLEDSNRDEEAFQEYIKANKVDAAQGGMNVDRLIRGARAVIKDVQPELVDKFSGLGNASEQPLFVIGVPRSGTSLTEQFLSAHPQVLGAGETQHWPAVMGDLVRRASPPSGTMIESIHRLDPHIWREAGDSYLSQFQSPSPEVAHIIDKLPGNFSLLPYIRLIFPKAKIIHVRRDPLATLYSCIKQHFRRRQLAFTVEGWAGYYGIYQEFVATWEPMLAGQMITIDYEELVSNFHEVVQRVVTFVGLEWNDACLHPERNVRAVKTASVDQVREPVHTKSTEKWRRHEAAMQPLLQVIDKTRESIRSGL